MADYQSRISELQAAEINVIGLSVDPPDKARQTVAELKIEFPLAWGLKVPEHADLIGAWRDDKRPMIQPAQFLIGRDGQILSATYSTGPIGRMRADDVLALVRLIEGRKGESR